MVKLTKLSKEEVERRLTGRVRRNKRMNFEKEILSLQEGEGIEIRESQWKAVTNSKFSSLPTYYYNRPETKGMLSIYRSETKNETVFILQKKATS
jgi:hypothetical protein